MPEQFILQAGEYEESPQTHRCRKCPMWIINNSLFPNNCKRIKRH